MWFVAIVTGKIFVSIICRNYIDSMESDTFYGDIMVKLIWRFSGSLIYYGQDIIISCYGLFMKNPRQSPN